MKSPEKPLEMDVIALAGASELLPDNDPLLPGRC